MAVYICIVPGLLLILWKICES